jgi:hypothetical protein
MKIKWMHFESILVLISYTFVCVESQFNDSLTAESNLTTKLFQYYKKDIRPSNLVNAYLSISEFELVDIDEKNQIMTSICSLYHFWQDPRIIWIPIQYNNITVIKVHIDTIWKPAMIVKNVASGDGFLPFNKEFSYISAYYNGFVEIQTQIASLKTRCKLNIEKYPFDKQTCFITLQEWPVPDYNYEDAKIFILPASSFFKKTTDIDFGHDYLSVGVRNSIWDVINTSQESVLNYTKYNITISVQRKPSFYILNIIIPCDILNIIVIFAFFIPFANQMSLGKYLSKR